MLGLLAQVLVASACGSQPTGAGAAEVQRYAPAETRTLRGFGAAADGRTDDTAALARALEQSDRFCLDGEGRTYRVYGTLRVGKDLCLRNATLVQALVPFDTAPYIASACPATEDPEAVINCGDPEIPARHLPALLNSLNVRTLLIRPDQKGDRIRVNLEDLKVDRGVHSSGGSRSDSAGIWLDGAKRVDFRNVEITGHGKGYGLLLSQSRNVTLTNLWVHDLVWSPYPGDARLSQRRIAAIGWNSVPIREFREAGRGGAATSKFYGVRVQEQVTCAFLSEVQHVRIENARVERCMARFDTGDLPWQADGLTIGRSSSDVVVNGALIDSAWEGMDVVAGGEGIDGLQINNLQVSNAFSFGLKLGYDLRNTRVSGLRVTNAGLAGLLIYGPVTGLQVADTAISNVGLVRMGARTIEPWPSGNRSGIRLDEGSGASAARLTPRNVLIERASVSTTDGQAQYEFGLLIHPGSDVQVSGFHARGFSHAEVRGGRLMPRDAR